ncbi:MAG: hypothetical protein HY370_04090, partial [Proteobacteria bacterium]|nr:hypothetical protein [Pseudomonadota bacterium]
MSGPVKSSKRVKIMHRINRLKKKAGVDTDDARLGFIDPKAVKRAQESIDVQAVRYSGEVETALKNLDDTWRKLKEEKDATTAAALSKQLYNYANNIKDMAETFGYSLMDHFGKSLRDFSKNLNVANKAHHVIVQAHIDVMWVAFNENIKDQGGVKAEELKLIVAKAIEK